MIAAQRPTILVTGGTGFVGSYVLKELATRDVSVVVTYRKVRLDRFQAPNVTWLEADLDNFTLIAQTGLKPDILMHLAWGGLPNYRSVSHVEDELPRQKVFLEEAIEYGVSNIFAVGTCFEYGLIEGELSEERKPEPHTQYGVAKDALRKHLQACQKKIQFNLTWARLFYLFGQGQGERSLFTQLHKAIAIKANTFDMSKGQQERDFLPIEIAANYLVDLALMQEDIALVNVCSGKPKRVQALVEKWLANAGATINLNLGAYPYSDYEAMSFWGDAQKLNRLLERA